MKRPSNAYDLARFIPDNRFIRDNKIDLVLKISEPAVFKSCRRLADAGYLDGETVREHGVPDKIIYSVNDRGRTRFHTLMEHFAGKIKPFFLDFNSVLWHIDNLDKAQARALLVSLQVQLHGVRDWIVAHEKEVPPSIPFGPRSIVRQYRMTLTTLAQWIDETLADFDESVG